MPSALVAAEAEELVECQQLQLLVTEVYSVMQRLAFQLNLERRVVVGAGWIGVGNGDGLSFLRCWWCGSTVEPETATAVTAALAAPSRLWWPGEVGLWCRCCRRRIVGGEG